MRAMGLAAGVCLASVAFAGVKHVEAPPKIDGVLDGVRWNYATVVKAKKQNVIGVEFAKRRPPFSSAALWGDRLKGAKLQVREGADWKDAAEGAPDGKWCCRFKLPGPISPEAIRITLPRGNVELYELEIFK